MISDVEELWSGNTVSRDDRIGLPHARVRHAGFTLLEVMMAVLVFGTALVALVQMLSLGRLGADVDAQRVVALSVLRHEAELMRMRDYHRLEDEAAVPLEDQPGYSRSLAVASAGDGLKLVTVTVHWESLTGNAVSESVQFVVADTVLPVSTKEMP